AHDDGLNDTVRTDRLRELLELALVDGRARLKGVRRETVDIGLDRRRARQVGEVRNQGAEAFAERWPFIHSSPSQSTGSASSGVAFYVTGAAARSSISRASATYAVAPRDFMS